MKDCERNMDKDKAIGCFDSQFETLYCPPETGKRPLNCKKYFGSDHLKYKRQKRFKCKNKRIRILAQPKYYTPKYTTNECRNLDKNIEISREVNLSTRIKMLAIPKVRKLVASAEQYRTAIDCEKLCNINNLIHHSMMTMYSRLANVHLTESRTPCRKWDAKDWQKHCEWLKKRACPKKIKEPKKPPRKVVPLSELEASFNNLSQPRYPREKYRPTYGYQSAVRNASKLYIPTKRLIKLSEPKKIKDELEEEQDENDEQKETFYANPNALKYIATDRIKQLATPKTIHEEKVKIAPPEKTVYGVVVRALKASLSERTLQLSKPKIKDDDDDEEKPAISPKALKAKATPRIIELAKPKNAQ
ncbi:uncharacterized protein Theg [Chironomus tepperi]|uniref:uncharacterized protein Theg n=1 Tax=Chironomus tepperi TaxID=113505 RepID=UPI00391F9FC2